MWVPVPKLPVIRQPGVVPRTWLSSQSAYIQSLLDIVPGFNLESIGRAPAQPLRVGLNSSLSFVASLGCPAHFNLLDGGHPCSDQKSFGVLFWEWSRQHLFSRAESIPDTARYGAECRKCLPYRERVSPMRSSLLAFTMGFGRSSGARLQSLVISWSTRFSGMGAYGLRVTFVSGSIRTIGKAHWCRRALGESRKRLRFLQPV